MTIKEKFLRIGFAGFVDLDKIREMERKESLFLVNIVTNGFFYYWLMKMVFGKSKKRKTTTLSALH